MDTPERIAVRRALDQLKPYLAAFLAQRGILVRPAAQQSHGPDVQALLKAFRDGWESQLRAELPRAANSYVHELMDVRNRWAHEEAFTPREARRAVDTVEHLASVIGAPERAAGAGTSEAAAAKVPAVRRAGNRREHQRDVMRRIYHDSGRDPRRAVNAYAAAERAGEVRRKSNKNGVSAEDYARALLADGEKKGWLN